MWIVLIIIFLAVILIAGWRKANENYTVGSGLFKKSDENLEKDRHLDSADFNYYNSKDKLK